MEVKYTAVSLVDLEELYSDPEDDFTYAFSEGWEIEAVNKAETLLECKKSEQGKIMSKESCQIVTDTLNKMSDVMGEVRTIHLRHPQTDGCAECSAIGYKHVDWPCPTLKAFDGITADQTVNVVTTWKLLADDGDVIDLGSDDDSDETEQEN